MGGTDSKNDIVEHINCSCSDNSLASNTSTGASIPESIFGDQQMLDPMLVTQDENTVDNENNNNGVSTLAVVADDTAIKSNSTDTIVTGGVHLTYNIDFDDDNDSIIQAATQLVIADSQCQFSSTKNDNDDNEEDDDDNNDVLSLNSFVVFDDPRNAGEKLPDNSSKKETRAQKKERQEKWKNMKDYGIIH